MLCFWLNETLLLVKHNRLVRSVGVGLENQVQAWVLPLTSCVTQGKLLNLSEFWFFHL